MAQYKANQVSYVDGATVEIGQLFTTRAYLDPKTKKLRHHTPGPHWEPVDDEAKAICREQKIEFTGEVPDIVNALSERLDGMMRDKAAASFDHAALADAIAKGIAAGMVAVMQAQADAAAAAGGKSGTADDAGATPVKTA